MSRSCKGLSPLQMREFLLDCDVRVFKEDDVIFQRNAIGSSLFGIASGSVKVEINPNDPSITMPIGQGSIFGEVGLISGRRRGATIRAGKDCIVVEIPRTAALKLMGSNEEAKKTVNRITTERHLLQIFGSGLAASDLAEILATARVEEIRPGQAVIREGDDPGKEYLARIPRDKPIDPNPGKDETPEAAAAARRGRRAETRRQKGRGPDDRRPARRRWHLRHLHRALRLHDGGKESGRQAGFPLLHSGRFLFRRNGAGGQKPAHRHGARHRALAGGPAGRAALPQPARSQARAARPSSKPT